jgi:hypothetical protein
VGVGEVTEDEEWKKNATDLFELRLLILGKKLQFINCGNVNFPFPDAHLAFNNYSSR